MVASSLRESTSFEVSTSLEDLLPSEEEKNNIGEMKHMRKGNAQKGNNSPLKGRISESEKENSEGKGAMEMLASSPSIIFNRNFYSRKQCYGTSWIMLA